MTWRRRALSSNNWTNPQYLVCVVNCQYFLFLCSRLVTSAGWNDVLDPLMAQPPDCDPDYKDLPNGNCGFPFVSIIYFVSFIIINFMIVINMYIAIILENFNQAHQEEEIGIVEEDLEMFYGKWSKSGANLFLLDFVWSWNKYCTRN